METKKSKIELLIDEIEDYIESCKYKPLSSQIIMVNKDEIDGLLMELRKSTPEEIKHYQKIIANRNAIIAEAERIKNDAAVNAKEIVDKAINQTNELISEHEIMQRAYDQANEIISLAAAQAQEIVDKAVLEANELKESATSYTDNLLGHVEEVTSHYMNMAGSDYERLMGGLQECLDTVRANRNELYPQVSVPEIAVPTIGGTTDFIPAVTAPTIGAGGVTKDTLMDLDLI